MNTRRFAGVMAGSCRKIVLVSCIVLASCIAAWHFTLGLAGAETTGAAPAVDGGGLALNADTKPAETSPAPATDNTATSHADGASTAADRPEASDKAQATIEAVSPSPSQILPAETALTPVTTTSRQDRAPDDGTRTTVSSVEVVDECWVVDICVDRYLWALYDRAPKEDTIKVPEQRLVTITEKIRKKRKTVTVTRTVTRTFTRLVDENFAWKDQKASEKAGMPMTDYVIGGMDRDFKLKLFHVLHAADTAGLSPGITSAFRDDYRQSIASGLKAANNRSFHGGSFRGGYGHGLAADVVSVKGATRAERWASTEILWKWIDAHGKEFGIARPYMGYDPPHVAPVDGQEYAKHFRADTTKHADAGVKKRKRVAAHEDHSRAKRKKMASAKTSKIRSARDTPSRTRLHG
jgi:hypothetical protein